MGKLISEEKEKCRIRMVSLEKTRLLFLIPAVMKAINISAVSMPILNGVKIQDPLFYSPTKVVSRQEIK
ncbi:hypothetical protein D3C86_1990550 [compost metagenome]